MQNDNLKHETPTDANNVLADVGLTVEETQERNRLLELQKSTKRWFSQEEFDRLKFLSEKMFKNAGSPHIR